MSIFIEGRNGMTTILAKQNDDNSWNCAVCRYSGRIHIAKTFESALRHIDAKHGIKKDCVSMVTARMPGETEIRID